MHKRARDAWKTSRTDRGRFVLASGSRHTSRQKSRAKLQATVLPNASLRLALLLQESLEQIALRGRRPVLLFDAIEPSAPERLTASDGQARRRGGAALGV